MKYILPPNIAAGVTFERCVTLADYPAPDWVLTAHLRGPDAIDLTAAADGAGHKFTEDAATTSTWAAGVYQYVIRATNGADVRQVEAGQLDILADLVAVDAGTDLRSHARRVLDAIEAVLEKRATLDQERYVIEGQNGRRELWRTPVADLLKLRDTYRAEVRREDAAARGKSLWGPAVRVRF